MSKFEKAVYGAPCWFELIPANLEQVKPFYKALFNWDFHDVGAEMGHYNLIQVGDDVVGGSMQHDAEMMGGSANYFSVFFATQDVDASLKAGAAMGGHIGMEAMEVPGEGEFGVALDPAGAGYCLWKPGRRQGFDRFGEPGFPAWFELMTREYDTSCAYYSGLLGAEIGIEEMPEGMHYATLNIDGEPHAGIFDIAGQLPDDVPNAWNVYLGVADTDAAVATVREQGGSVVQEPEDSPHGRMAVVADPGGAVFNIISVV